MSTMEEVCERMMMHSSMEMTVMGHDAGHQDMMYEKMTTTSSDCEMTVDCDCNDRQNPDCYHCTNCGFKDQYTIFSIYF